eukprot:g10246.t1
MALGSRQHSIAVFLSLFALSIGIAAVAIGAQQEWTCSTPLAAYLVDVGGIMLGFTPALLCAYRCFVTITNPLDPGDAMGFIYIELFGGGCMCCFGLVTLGCLISAIVLTFSNGLYAWELSSDDASRGDYCDEKLISGARGIVVALSVLLGLLVVSPVACFCCGASVSLFDTEAKKAAEKARMEEKMEELGIDPEEWDKTLGEASNSIATSSVDVGVALRRKSFEMA